jgi:hypothetical protein
MSYTTCSLCDLNNPNPSFSDVEILPLLGVEESVITHNYCNVCSIYTPWFMGGGNNPTVHEFLQDNITSTEGELKELNNQIDELKRKRKSFFGLSFFPIYSLKIKRINDLKREMESSLEYRVSELEDYLKEKQIRDDFYHNITPKPQPKCLLCGNKELLSDPIIHECGGQISLTHDNSFKPNYTYSKHFQFYYDQYGTVTMMELNCDNNELDEQWIESKEPYLERIKTYYTDYEKRKKMIKENIESYYNKEGEMDDSVYDLK